MSHWAGIHVLYRGILTGLTSALGFSTRSDMAAALPRLLHPEISPAAARCCYEPRQRGTGAEQGAIGFWASGGEMISA
jgi:hypothetical protein